MMITNYLIRYCFTYVVTTKSINCMQKNGINIFGFPLIAPKIIVRVIINEQNIRNNAKLISSEK